MFVDMRSWTARTSVSAPSDVVEVMNDFFRVTVRVVEEKHRGMVNKYLGDGFMAIFGAGDSGSNHAGDGVGAGIARAGNRHEALRSEEHTPELQSHSDVVSRLPLANKTLHQSP